MSSKPIFVVAGVGNALGTGGAAARAFSRAGYRVALIARSNTSSSDTLNKFAQELSTDGNEAAAFPIPAYNYASMHDAFASIRTRWPSTPIRAALWNAGQGVFKPFLDVTEADIAASLETNVAAAFAFAREAVLAFKAQDIDARGARGTLVFTGATAGTRGNVMTSAFAAGKFGVRALAQSLAKEFGRENIHVRAQAIIDGSIMTDRLAAYADPKTANNPDLHLKPEDIAEAYLYLTTQPRSAWTWELDLRPAHEKW
ncbi:short-chain dehydrogenase/reductase SDR [Dentipellis sp. KUC8613]|nr:short-chain dehydrogenase/reductase SDR [Dentipellis sp. KUC8613]